MKPTSISVRMNQHTSDATHNEVIDQTIPRVRRLTFFPPLFYSMKMMDDSDIETYCGIPSEREGGFFDPFGLSKGKDEETLRWYRSAELKHGRVSMLATLGIVIQGFNTKIIPGFPVTETNEIEALKKVYYEAPSALVQV
jgi:Chlorophyll A-B binding protein